MTAPSKALVGLSLSAALALTAAAAFAPHPPRRRAFAPPGSRAIPPPAVTCPPQPSAVPPPYLFGGIFGSDDGAAASGELARFSGVATSGDKYGALSEYVRLWSEAFERDAKGSGLTTPVKVFPSDGTPGDEDGDVVASSGVRIVFQPTKTGDAYKSRDEEREAEDADGGPSEEEGEVKKEGGVEVLVERLGDGEVRVRARRCDVEEGTVIKEMSEETIVKKLREAIDVWKKEQK